MDGCVRRALISLGKAVGKLFYDLTCKQLIMHAVSFQPFVCLQNLNRSPGLSTGGRKNGHVVTLNVKEFFLSRV